MGRMLIEAVQAAPTACWPARWTARQPSIGLDATGWLGMASGVAITDDLAQGLAQADVLIDFTRPEGTLAHLAACRAKGVRMVIGTTGFTDAEGRDRRRRARHRHRDVAQHERGRERGDALLDMASRALNQGYDIEIIEAHHRHKVDAPSGTALAMGEVVAQALGRDLGLRRVRPRGRDRRARSLHHRLRHRARRRHRRRPHRAVRRHRRAHRDHPQEQQPRHLRPGQPARRALPGRPGRRPVHDERRAGILIGMDGLQDFWSQSDAIGRSVALLLLAMSVGTWVVILWKAWLLRRALRSLARATRLLAGPGPGRRPGAPAQPGPGTAAGPAGRGRGPARHPRHAGEAGSAQAQLTRRLRDALHGVLGRLQRGQVLLASVGATAPFIGLFGTVWGIYHALLGISTRARCPSTRWPARWARPDHDRLGLAVAIPAVLAYNLFSKWLGQCEAELEGFAQDLLDLALRRAD
jgi:dihydrodipicolinate reductase/biopolymer transport protein ExbB/TolQ